MHCSCSAPEEIQHIKFANILKSIVPDYISYKDHAWLNNNL